MNRNDIAEFKGQIVDIFEDYFETKDITLMNLDKEIEIRNGVDESTVAIIYGQDYDVIADTVDSHLVAGGLYSMSKNSAKELITDLITNAQSLIKSQQEISRADYTVLACKIKETLCNWDLLKEYPGNLTISCRIENKEDIYTLSQVPGCFYIFNLDKTPEEAKEFTILDGWSLPDIEKEPLDLLAFLEGPAIPLGTEAYQMIEFPDIEPEDVSEEKEENIDLE